MTSVSDVMNAVDAATFLGVHVETLRKLARRNDIPCFKIGRDWRFRKEALLRWADEQRPGESRCSVLIVDDDEKICSALCHMVEQMGCSTRAATSGAAGLELVAESAPDLILLDLMMPGMNGPHFLGRLRRDHRRLMVIIITGHPDSDLVSQAMEYAPIMLLAKPVDRALLERTMRGVAGEKMAPARGGTG